MSDDSSKTAHDAARVAALDVARKAIRAGNADRGGDILLQGIEEYDKISRDAVDGLYATARSIHDPEFDLSDVQSLAGKLRPGDNLEKVIDEILKLRPDVRTWTTPEGVVSSAFDQMKALRCRLYDLTRPPFGMPATEEHVRARMLYGALSNALDNPVGGPPEFRAAWCEASTAAARRSETLERLSEVRAVKEFRVLVDMAPYDAYRKLMRPGMEKHLAWVRENISSERWEELRGAFKDDLLRSPDTLRERLKEFDEEAINLLLTWHERAELNRVANAFDSIKSTGVEDALVRQKDGDLPAVPMPPEIETALNSLNRRLTELESRQSTSWIGKLFGRQ